MVSTRGHKCKFSDGERVLCYEPDPTKAKVLYDSKVLKVITQKDDRGRRNTEYLIHFQGWNSSWDRCVSEDYVLKDTDENRKLQRNLADKAQLQLGAYLYRRERKKRGRIASEEGKEGGGIGRINSCSSQEGEEEEEEEEEEDLRQERGEVTGRDAAEDEDMLTTSDDEKDSAGDTDDSLEEKIPVDLSDQMKEFLEHDYDLIHRHNQILRLPAKPTVVELLESYVHHVGTVQLQQAEQHSRHARRSRPKPPRCSEADAQAAEATLNLCREVVDGLRICFDFTLGTSLLYATERPQWEEVQSGRELGRLSPDETTSDDTSQTSHLSQASQPVIKVEIDHGDTDRRRSLRSHKDQSEPAAVVPAPAQSPHPGENNSKLTVRNLAEQRDPVNNHSHHCSAQSSSSSSSYCGPLSAHVARPHPSPLCSNSVLVRVVAANSQWSLVPPEYLRHRPHHPAAVYGAVHLARLFVKLPHMLYIANQPDQPDKENQPRVLSERKLKALLHHLHLFLKYLESKSEWFGEKHYMENNKSAVKMESE